jgi:hypothetical protein
LLGMGGVAAALKRGDVSPIGLAAWIGRDPSLARVILRMDQSLPIYPNNRTSETVGRCISANNGPIRPTLAILLYFNES